MTHCAQLMKTQAFLLSSLFFTMTAVAQTAGSTPALMSGASDEYFNQQWYLQNNGYSVSRDITQISSYTVKGVAGDDLHFPFQFIQLQPQIVKKQVVVAVLDTGVDIDHPELKDAILKAPLECNTLGGLPPVAAPDKDGNGFKGDCAGWNFASSTNINGDNQVYDDVGHGTHVAGIIAAKIDSVGTRGISDLIKILPVKVLGKYEQPGNPMAPKANMMNRIAGGLKYAIDKNVDVINLSMGWPSFLDSPQIRALFDLAEQKNILIVAAAGNDSQHTTIFPCSYKSVICVGASTVDGSMSDFSNYGGNVDLMAPGEQILSTTPRTITSMFFDQDGYDFKNGTSQAAPMVAGSAALLKLYLGDISTKELKARLFASAQRSGDPLLSLYGEINLNQALAIKPDQFLYLNTKELNTVAVGYPNGKFSFNLELDKLLPGSVDQAQIQVSASDSNLVLDQNSFSTAFTDTQDTVLISVTGTVANLSADSTQVLSFDLTYGSNHYSFKREVVFALDSKAVSVKSAFPDNTNLSTLRSVDDPFTLSANPVFFTQAVQNGTTLQFYYRANGKVNPLLSMAKSAGIQITASTFVGSTQMFLEFYDQPGKKLTYELWDLVQAKVVKSIDMVPDTVLFDPSKGVLLNGDHMMAASLLNGKIPPSEQEQSVWVKKDTSSNDHIYFFEEKSGALVTELLDNTDFLNQIRKQYSLAYNDPVTPLAVLTNGPSQSISTLFAIGTGYSRKVLAVNFTGHKQYTIQNEYQVPAGGALQKIPFLNQMMIAVQERSGAYQVFDLNTGGFTEYTWSGALNDNLTGPIAALDSRHILAQTQKNYVVLGDGQFSSIALKRFSFLPGSLFSENFMPVTVTTPKGPMNALFVDQTLISEKHLGVLMWNGQNIVKPILFQEELPSGCSVMNPQRTGSNYSIFLKCQTGTSSYLLERALVTQ